MTNKIAKSTKQILYFRFVHNIKTHLAVASTKTDGFLFMTGYISPWLLISGTYNANKFLTHVVVWVQFNTIRVPSLSFIPPEGHGWCFSLFDSYLNRDLYNSWWYEITMEHYSIFLTGCNKSRCVCGNQTVKRKRVKWLVQYLVFAFWCVIFTECGHQKRHRWSWFWCGFQLTS